MYFLNYWRLTHSPFSDFDPEGQSPSQRVLPSFFYCGSVQEEALARLQFLVEHRHSLGLLVGPTGAGKSLLLRAFARRVWWDGQPVVRLRADGCDLRGCCWQLAEELGLAPHARRASFELWRDVCDALGRLRTLKQDLVLLVDDLDRAEQDCLEGLLRLFSANRHPDGRLTAVVSGGSESLEECSGRLMELAELRIELTPLLPEETRDYLKHRLSACGRDDLPFTNAAVGRLQELSGGVPRMLNQLAELCLIAAASHQLPYVDTQTVDGVATELGQQPPSLHAA